MRGWIFMLVTAGFLQACGPSSMQVRHAEEANYFGHRDELWPKIVDVLKERFEKLSIAELDGEHLLTQWMPTGRYLSYAGNDLQATTRLELVRVKIALAGQNPFQVKIDVEASVFLSDHSAPVPFTHGAAEEPPWVSSLGEDLTLTMHDRLKEYAHAP
jgi:hypothetical protein